MKDAVDLIYVALILSLPFLLGMACGRGLRREGLTKEHEIGAHINSMVASALDDKLFIGRGFSTSRTSLATTRDGAEVTVEIRVADAKLGRTAE